MKESQKQAVSLRLGAADIRRIKRLAKRLGVRDSDVIRYALKAQLARLSALCDPAVRGRELVLALAEPAGIDVLQHFELDEENLDRIVNDGVEPGARVDRADLQAMIMLAVQSSYLKLGLHNVPAAALVASGPADTNGASADGAMAALRRHLQAKYLQPQSAAGHNRRATDRKPVA